MSDKPKLILVCGPSGSGKTTLSKMIAESLDMTRISADDFYAKVNGDEKIHTNKFEVWIELFKEIRKCETGGVDCIVDSNYLSSSSRDELVNWFSDFEHHIIYVDADDALRMQNNRMRGRQIPDDVMLRMRVKAEPPVWKTMDKRWKSLVRLSNIENRFIIIQKEGEITYGTIENWIS